jgi:hypothetical protein
MISLANSALRTGMKIIAETLPNNPRAALEAEAEAVKLLETDPKLKFLHQLYSIKRTWIFKFGKPSKNITPTTLSEIQTQYATLKASTDQFKDEKDKKQYFDDIDQQIAQIVTVFELQKEHKKYYDEMRNMGTNNTLREARPSYAEGLVDKSWQQFLDKEAPGWPVDWASQPDVLAKQRIPNGGVRIIEDWEKEVAEVFNDLDAVRGGPSRFKSGLFEAQKTRVIAPDGTKAKTFKIVCILQPL